MARDFGTAEWCGILLDEVAAGGSQGFVAGPDFFMQ
jgi:hypothetical protein